MSDTLNDRQLKECGLKKVGSIEIATHPEEDKEFRMKVHELYTLSIREKSTLSPLLKTSATFDHSLGDIYEYLKDAHVCSQCPNKLSSCPKDLKGYALSPRYDRYNDCIRLAKLPCPLKKKELEILSGISPCYIDSRIIKSEASQLMNWVNRPTNSKQLVDTSKIMKAILMEEKGFEKENETPGHSFFAINSYALARKLLFYSGYLYRAKGYSVGHVDMNSLMESLRYATNDPHDDARVDFYRATKAQCLMVENMDALPFLTEELKTKYLPEFILKRAEKGKVTFFALKKNVKISSLVRPFIYGNNEFAKLMDLCDDLAKMDVIKDLPL